MPNDTTTDTRVGPPASGFLSLVLKSFAGLGGGIVGMLILLVIFLGASTILNSGWNTVIVDGSLPEGGGKNPLFIFVFMAMIFITSMISNILAPLFFSFVQSEKYTRRTTSMYQIFFMNLAIFVLLAPLYFLLDSRGSVSMVSFLAGFHVVLSALASMVILEIVGNIRYALVGFYGVIFATVMSTATVLTIFEFTGHNPTSVLFATLPLLWMAMGFYTSVCEMFYRWLWSLYGTDFMMSQVALGNDYGGALAEAEDAPPPPDVDGADFLGK